MFSMQKLIENLENNQENFDDSIIDKIELPKCKLDENVETIYETYITNAGPRMEPLCSDLTSKFKYISCLYKDSINWKSNTFIYSILRMLDNNYDFMLNKRKKELIDVVKKKMCYDLVEKNYYNKFGYTRKKKI